MVKNKKNKRKTSDQIEEAACLSRWLPELSRHLNVQLHPIVCLCHLIRIYEWIIFLDVFRDIFLFVFDFISFKVAIPVLLAFSSSRKHPQRFVDPDFERMCIDRGEDASLEGKERKKRKSRIQLTFLPDTSSGSRSMHSCPGLWSPTDISGSCSNWCHGGLHGFVADDATICCCCFVWATTAETN